MKICKKLNTFYFIPFSSSFFGSYGIFILPFSSSEKKKSMCPFQKEKKCLFCFFFPSNLLKIRKEMKRWERKYEWSDRWSQPEKAPKLIIIVVVIIISIVQNSIFHDSETTWSTQFQCPQPDSCLGGGTIPQPSCQLRGFDWPSV
jgi:hypothetical protein